MGFSGKETLCWRCKRPGTGTCSWDKSRGNVPVEGWTADEVPFMSWIESRATTTFRVIDCPLFDPEEDYDERMKRSFYAGEGGKREDKQKRNEEIENLIHYGWTDLAIALKFKLSSETIRKYRQEWRKKQREQERKGKK